MKVKFGMMMTDGRGKLGGQVASKNRGGAYIRTKVTPVNPQTLAQQGVRGVLTAYSQGWRSLTQAQRDAWNSAVSQFAKTDIFGDIKNPSGINLYVKLNVNLTSIGQSPIFDPPLPDSPYVTGEFTLTAAEGAGTMSLAWVGGPVPAGVNWLVEATEQVSPGKSFVKNLYRIIEVLPAADATPTSIYASYIAKFGTLTAGQKVFVRVTPVSMTTGVQGGALSTYAVVAA